MPPPASGCAQELEKCTTAADCCGAGQGFLCINGHCAAARAALTGPSVFPGCPVRVLANVTSDNERGLRSGILRYDAAMLFNRATPDVTGAKVEAQLRKELALRNPISYATLTQAESPSGPGELSEALGRVWRNQTDRLHVHRFQFTEPRPWELRVGVTRTVQSYILADDLLYAAVLNKPVAVEVTMNDGGTFPGGDPVAEKLNADKTLRKDLARFARTELKFGDRVLKGARHVVVRPSDGAAELIVGTMPRPKWFGTQWFLDPQEFLRLAARIEALL